MMPLREIFGGAVLLSIAFPAGLLAFLALAPLLPRRRASELGEATITRATSFAMVGSVGSLAIALALYLGALREPQIWTLRRWFSSAEGTFELAFLVDGWSLTFALLSATISGVVSAFSARYLHKDPGLHRYFTLFSCFVLGILLVAMAGSVEVLFTGWELLGLSSALLVAFFQQRRAPAQSAFRVFAAYRMSDAALMSTAVYLHHEVGTGSLSAVFLADPSSSTLQTLSGAEATAIGIALIAAVAGKSALLPFSGWLPRAMEGPTPSSAVYYGALSLHAGCYLLWRARPLLEQSTPALVIAGALGAGTAAYATVVARAQTDVKATLSYAALTQVGLIVLEIALGLRTLAFIHMLGHVSFRLLQFLSAPSVLHDLHGLSDSDGPRERAAPRAIHFFALERGFVDTLVDRAFVGPFVAAARCGERLDRWLAGERVRSDERQAR